MANYYNAIVKDYHGNAVKFRDITQIDKFFSNMERAGTKNLQGPIRIIHVYLKLGQKGKGLYWGSWTAKNGFIRR